MFIKAAAFSVFLSVLYRLALFYYCIALHVFSLRQYSICIPIENLRFCTDSGPHTQYARIAAASFLPINCGPESCMMVADIVPLYILQNYVKNYVIGRSWQLYGIRIF